MADDNEYGGYDIRNVGTADPTVLDALQQAENLDYAWFYRLCVAVLSQAVDDLRYAGKNPKLIRERRRAHDWFQADEPELAFSFEWVCLALGVEASVIRKAMEPRKRRVNPRIKRRAPRLHVLDGGKK